MPCDVDRHLAAETIAKWESRLQPAQAGHAASHWASAAALEPFEGFHSISGVADDHKHQDAGKEANAAGQNAGRLGITGHVLSQSTISELGR
jgi:hypothetical protein